MNNDEIIKATLAVFQNCKIKSFPIDCYSIIDAYGYELIEYSKLSKKRLEACMKLSNDSCVIESKKKIFYNSNVLQERIRFSLMHELGHIITKSDSESDANNFSSNLLAPRMAIHYSRCQNAADVMKRFKISEPAANIAFDDYRVWRRTISIKGMTDLDKCMYEHFYNEEAQKFVFNIKTCDRCGKNLFNLQSKCVECLIYDIRRRSEARYDYNTNEFELDIARGNWLYGGL